MSLNAPLFTTDNSEEGTYRIVASQGGVELPHDAGVCEFTVGHAWNLPNTFTTLDYGLYWFKDKYNGLKARTDLPPGVVQDDEYFDASKPTVIYVHGWQPDQVAAKGRESWLRVNVKNAAITYDMATVWKDRGYNVGLFNWNQFGDLGGDRKSTRLNSSH